MQCDLGPGPKPKLSTPKKPCQVILTVLLPLLSVQLALVGCACRTISYP